MSAIELGAYLHARSQQYHECIEACVACLIACEGCSDACLEEGNVGAMTDCIRFSRDCADACSAALRVMARGSEQARDYCATCADFCDACAAECEKHASMADHCRVCAEACRRCAAACRELNEKSW